MGFERKTTEVKCHPHHITSTVCVIHMTLLLTLTLIIWLKYLSIRFLSVKVQLLPPLLLHSSEGNHQPIITEKVVSFPHLGSGIYINYLEFFCSAICVFIFVFIYLVMQSSNYLYQYGLMDTYFIFWVILQYHIYFVLIVAREVIERSSIWLLCPFTKPIILFFELQTHLHIRCPSLTVNHFSKKPWFLLLEHGIRNQHLGVWYAHCF